MSGFSHVPVLLEAVGERLITGASPQDVYVDGTLGGGGHAEMVLSRTQARLIGIDRDPAALNAATERLKPYGERFQAIRGNFDDMPDLLRSAGIESATGILMDLGVSSHQFDEPSRGFAFQHLAALDMRMDPDQELSAADVVNGYSADELARVLWEYGEERHSRRIARAIEAARPLSTTAELAETVMRAMPGHSKKGGPHPARRTFQAIRIEVNGELEILPGALRAAFGCLRLGGRLAVISFHSLEDRIVKEFVRGLTHPCTCPPKAPICICGKKPEAVDVARGGIPASEAEIEENPRARSARLRVAEKILP